MLHEPSFAAPLRLQLILSIICIAGKPLPAHAAAMLHMRLYGARLQCLRCCSTRAGLHPVMLLLVYASEVHSALHLYLQCCNALKNAAFYDVLQAR
jgi:hypothetical protein